MRRPTEPGSECHSHPPYYLSKARGRLQILELAFHPQHICVATQRSVLHLCSKEHRTEEIWSHPNLLTHPIWVIKHTGTRTLLPKGVQYHSDVCYLWSFVCKTPVATFTVAEILMWKRMQPSSLECQPKKLLVLNGTTNMLDRSQTTALLMNRTTHVRQQALLWWPAVTTWLSLPYCVKGSATPASA